MSHRAVLLCAVSLSLALSACGPGRMLGGPPLPHEAERMGPEEAVARVERALADVPEIAIIRSRLAAEGHRLVVLHEGDADVSADSPRVWQVFVGEARDTLLVRLWAFNVDAVTGALTVFDPVTLEDVSFARWRDALGAATGADEATGEHEVITP